MFDLGNLGYKLDWIRLGVHIDVVYITNYVQPCKYCMFRVQKVLTILKSIFKIKKKSSFLYVSTMCLAPPHVDNVVVVSHVIAKAKPNK